MKIARLTLYILITLLLQLGVVGSIDKSGIFPNLIILAQVWLIFNAPLWDALLAALVFGFFLDTYSVSAFGIFTFIAVFNVTLLSWLLRHIFPKEEKFGLVLLAFTSFYISVVGAYLLIFLLRSSAELDVSRFLNFNNLLSLGLSLLLYYFLSSFLRRYVTNFNEQGSVRTQYK